MELPTAIGIGALLLGGAWVLGRRAALASGPQAGSGTDPCAGLTGDAKTACQAIQIGAGVINTLKGQGVDFGILGGDERDPHAGEADQNIALNGKVTKSIPAEILAAAKGGAAEGFWRNYLRPIAWFVAPHLQYANGCVPFKDAAGWSKCAQGTHEMIRWEIVGDPNSNGLFARVLGDTAKNEPINGGCWSNVGNGGAGCDPLTFPVDHLDAASFAYPRPAKSCPAGYELWWVGGVATCLPPCPAGASRADTNTSPARGGPRTVDQRLGPPGCIGAGPTVDRNGQPLAAGGSPAPRASGSVPTRTGGTGRDHRT